jgi:hypothetical protein
MRLRKELEAPSIPEEKLLAVRTRLEAVEKLFEQNKPTEEAIREFNQFTGRVYTADKLRYYNAVESIDAFCRKAARPKPQRVLDISREELLEVVRRAMPTTRDPDYEYYMELFDAQVAMPCASGLIFWPDDSREIDISTYDPTPEEIVDKALAYKPIHL